MRSKLDILRQLVGKRVILHWHEPGVYTVETTDLSTVWDHSLIHGIYDDFIHVTTTHRSSPNATTERWIDTHYINEIRATAR